tara:strand:+ start:2253 stop:3092 length:840 start_codon:yes stop_codon:yes gene_type:complete
MSRHNNSNILEYCRVIGCRFKGTHTWQDHICGTCGEKGHGQIECGNYTLINDIKNYGKNDVIKKELWCNSIGCKSKKYHTSSSHLCNYCLDKNKNSSQCYHTVQECPLDSNPYKKRKIEYTHKIECPLCRAENRLNINSIEKIYGIDAKCQICVTNNVDFLLEKCKHCIMCIDCAKQIMVVDNSNNNNTNSYSNPYISEGDDYWDDSYALNIMGDTPGKIFIKKYGGMGSTIFIKRDDIGQPLEEFMMHQDSWGQYGPETSEVPQLEEFLNGYTEVNYT